MASCLTFSTSLANLRATHSMSRMIVVNCLSIAYYDHLRDAKAGVARREIRREGGGLRRPVGEAVIYHGVGTNCLLALLLWTFNNNKSHTTRYEMRPKQGAIFTYLIKRQEYVISGFRLYF